MHPVYAHHGMMRRRYACDMCAMVAACGVLQRCGAACKLQCCRYETGNKMLLNGNQAKQANDSLCQPARKFPAASNAAQHKLFSQVRHSTGCNMWKREAVLFNSHGVMQLSVVQKRFAELAASVGQASLANTCICTAATRVWQTVCRSSTGRLLVAVRSAVQVSATKSYVEKVTA
jgi:hypothetical protein